MCKTILITGGAGFIGSNLIDKLLAKTDYKIINIDNFDPFYDKALKIRNIEAHQSYLNYDFIEADIKDKHLLEEIFSLNKIDLVIHLAAKAGVRPSLENPIEYYEDNVLGTLKLLEVMKEFNVKSMLFASSSSVYGNNKKIPFSEDDVVDKPISPYASTKKACETLCYNYHKLYDFNIYAFRFFTVYGPKQRPEMAIAKFTRAVLNGDKIELYSGNNKTARDYTFIDDIVNGLINAIERVSGFEIFNLGNSHVTELNELVAIIENVTGKKAIIEKLPMQPGDVNITFSDISKAKKLLEYEPKTNIKDGIKKYYDWYQKNFVTV